MKKILNGNEAFAHGALAAGLNFYAGYPITPSTDVYELLEAEHEKYGVTFVHASSEISAANMIMGASTAGARALTVTSGCGFSLMQEAISYMAADFVPCVILNVMREGAGLGDIPRSQGDYDQMTKGGGNGDYHAIVLSCSSIRDCMEMPELAYELAEKYRNPVIVTYDSDIAHTRESVEILPARLNDIDRLDYTLKGNSTGAPKLVQNVNYHDPDFTRDMAEKYALIEQNEQRYRCYETEDAEVILVAYSICARVCRDVVKRARAKGLKVGLIVHVTLYPFPEKAFRNIPNCRRIIVVELSILRQLRRDVEYYTRFRYTYDSVSSMSTCPTVLDILEVIGEQKDTELPAPATVPAEVSKELPGEWKMPEVQVLPRSGNYNMLCAGCGHRTAMMLLDDIIRKKGLAERVTLMLDVACCSLMIDDVEYDSVMCAHGRVLDVTKGYKETRKQNVVISYMGDGAAYAIGIEELIHAARRNDDAFIVVINNGLFSMTGGQISPAYIGTGTEDAEAGFLVENVIGKLPIRYLARAALSDRPHIDEARLYLERALDGYLREGGFHMVELLSPCPTNYKRSPKEMTDLINDYMSAVYHTGELRC